MFTLEEQTVFWTAPGVIVALGLGVWQYFNEDPARLQQLNRSANPVLLYVYGSGYGIVYSYQSWLDLRTVMLSFMFNEMGVKPRI